MSHRRHKYVHRSEPHDLSDVQEQILVAIGLWYDGVTFIRPGDGAELNIRENRPPNIDVLVRALQGISGDEWEQTYAPEFSDLAFDGWVKQEYFLRTRVPWAPTRKAREFLDDRLAGETEYDEHIPSRWDTSEHGLVGDMNETLRHRTGVAITYTGHRRHNQVPEESVIMYPGDGGRRRGDLHFTFDGVPWLAEVLTFHNDYEAYKKKYEFAVESDRNVLYVGQSREAVNLLLNRWHNADDLEADFVNFPIENHEQRALKHTRDYINRSRESDDHAAPGVDDITTMTWIWDNFVSEK